MELLLLLFSTLVLSTLTLFLSLKLLCSKRSNASRLPPGRMGWPFFGETLEFLSTGRKGVPEKFFHDRMSRYSPEIFKTSLLAEKMVVLCGAAGNKFLFTNEAKLVTSWLPRNVKKLFPSTTTPGEDPVKTRRFLAGFLKPDALQKYVGTMDAIAKEQLDAYWDSEEEIDVFPLAKRFTVEVACRLLLSIDDPDHVARLEEPVHALLVGGYSLPINFPGTNFNRAMRASGLIRREVMEIIKVRKRDHIVVHRDVLDHMLTATDEDGRFRSEPDIADKIMGLIIGGQDATSALITFIVKYLAELPHIYDNVLKEQREIAAAACGENLGWEDLQKMKYSWNVVCEVMRLAPPVQGNFREAIIDFTYAGFSVPKGWKLYWNANMTHKNPEYFEEPEKFDPSRFEGKGPILYSYVPFGGGSRMCPVQEYARIEILVFMHSLVRTFKWEKVFPHEKIVVDHS